jgi:ribonuclease P protein component
MPRIAQTISQFSRQEIAWLIKKARRVVTHPGLHILVAPVQGEHEHGKILVITSRKIGNAPVRNKIRRQFKAMFYQEKLYEKGLDCVIIVKRPGTELAFKDLKELLMKVFAPYGRC